MAHRVEHLLQLMARLRDPVDGCPWDREQTLRSVVPHTLEETYELIDAIEHDDLPHVLEELGDVLFQVVFYARIAEERGAFTFADVVDNIVRKLLRRHPHVFPDGSLESRAGHGAPSAAAVHDNWETLKAEERIRRDHVSLLDDVPLALPGVLRAAKLQRRAARAGFDWREPAPVLEKVHEELAELAAAMHSGDADECRSELGDVLFAVVNLARHLELDPEVALREANSRFERRFRDMERAADADGRELAAMDPEEREELWQQAKVKLAGG